MESEATVLEQTIDRYVAGQLSEKEAEALWSELLLNEEAMDYFKTSASLQKLYVAAPVRKLGLNPLLAVAAVLLGSVIMLNLFRFTEESYVQQFSFDRIEDTGFESLRDVRDDASSGTAEDSLFDTALNMALSGDMERAKLEFEKFTRAYPFSVSAPKAWLNIGITLYNQGQIQESLEAFQQAHAADRNESRFLTEKIFWFEANAFYKQKDFQNARVSAAEALKCDGAYHNEAFELVRYLDYKLGFVDYKPVSEPVARPAVPGSK